MNCINFKIKQKNYKNFYYCKIQKKQINFDDCRNCQLKQYKGRKEKKMKVKTTKLAKLEKNRFSLFTTDLEHCIICGKSPVNKHEIFYGRNRQNSMKFGLVIPLCTEEHHNQVGKTGIHFDIELCAEWHKKGQIAFEETYPDLDFVSIFRKNHLP